MLISFAAGAFVMAIIVTLAGLLPLAIVTAERVYIWCGR